MCDTCGRDYGCMCEARRNRFDSHLTEADKRFLMTLEHRPGTKRTLAGVGIWMSVAEHILGPAPKEA